MVCVLLLCHEHLRLLVLYAGHELLLLLVGVHRFICHQRRPRNLKINTSLNYCMETQRNIEIHMSLGTISASLVRESAESAWTVLYLCV